jgi:predicted nucleic acid-binding protein
MSPAGQPEIVLVDTSAWIDFFAGRGQKAIREAIGELLDNDLVATAGPIVLELLRGCRSAPERIRLEQNLRALHWLPVDERHWDRAGAAAFRLRRRGVTVSAVDALIATLAESAGCPLLQNDRDFVHIARHTGLRLH